MWQPMNIFPAGHFWREHHVKAAADVKLEDVFDPGFWIHVANRLRPLDTIVIKSEAGTFAAALHVISVQTDGAVVQPVWLVDLTEKAPVRRVSKTVTVGWGGPNHKWRLVRGNEVLAYGFDSKDEADAKVAEYE